MKRNTKFLLFFFITLLNCSLLFAENRVALVIGNANYSRNPLKNPVKDAAAIKVELESLGFKVIYGTDLETADQMDDKLRDFYKASKDADLALLYYSGHGIQSGDVNYLLPLSSAIKSEDDLERKAVNLQSVIYKASSTGVRQLIVMIDACRNNPLKTSKGSSRGLSVVSVSDLCESYIVFACGSGKTADDGDGDHSPFTQALINHLGEQGVGFSEVMRNVTAEVQRITNNEQSPYKSDNISSEIYLNGKDRKKGSENHKKDSIYKEDKTDTKKIIGICVVLFFILLIIMLLCFVFFTGKGKEIFAQFTQKTKETTTGTVKFVSAKAESLKSGISAYSKKEKEKLAKMREDQNLRKQEIQHLNEQRAEENKRMEMEESRYMENADLPCIKFNNHLYVAKTPVTVGQYKKITGLVLDQNENLPVTKISWIDAVTFLNCLSKSENLEPVYDLSDPKAIQIDLSKNGWRLPTEKEWKAFAAQPADFEQNAWYMENAGGSVPACGKKNSNKYGLQDVYGLVWEWCNDVLKVKYHVLKGGAWDCPKKYCSSGAKMTAVKEFSSDAIGFRGVRNI